jgi:hypothetical protein
VRRLSRNAKQQDKRSNRAYRHDRSPARVSVVWTSTNLHGVVFQVPISRVVASNSRLHGIARTLFSATIT